MIQTFAINAAKCCGTPEHHTGAAHVFLRGEILFALVTGHDHPNWATYCDSPLLRYREAFANRRAVCITNNWMGDRALVNEGHPFDDPRQDEKSTTSYYGALIHATLRPTGEYP